MQSSYQKAGLIPLNSEPVLRKLKLFQARQNIESDSEREEEIAPPSPSTPLRTPSPTFANWPTPLTMRTRKKGYDFVQSRQAAAIKGTPITPSVIRVIDKLESSAQRSMYSGALSTHRVHDLSIAAARRQKKSDGGKIVQKYSEIYGYQALKDITEDRAEEGRVANMRHERLLRACKVHFTKKVLPEFLAEVREGFNKAVFIYVRFVRDFE